MTESQLEYFRSLPAYRKFFEVINGYNFITNEPVDYFIRGKYAIELSHGMVMSSHIYGVTFVDTTKKERAMDLDKPFSSNDRQEAYKQAMEYIDSFKE